MTIIVISLMGVFLARDPESSVFAIVSFAWAGFGGAFGALTLCALFWKRSNYYGALAGMVSGGIMVFVWKYAVRPLGGIWDIYELLPAFLVSLLSIVVVSLLTGKPEKEIEEEFEASRKMVQKEYRAITDKKVLKFRFVKKTWSSAPFFYCVK